MLKSPVLRFCYSEMMSDEKKFSHAGDQGNFRLFVVIAHEMFVERSYALIVLDTVHTNQGEDLPEERVSCPADFSSALEGRT